MMKILVPIKKVLDTNQRIRVDDSGRALNDSGIPYIINPFDLVALEEAIRIREELEENTEIIAVGIGDDDHIQKLRSCLAMGADRAIHIAGNNVSDPWNVARILQSVAGSESPDLVITGERGMDDDGYQPGQYLAARMGWPQATFARKVDRSGGEWVVERETDLGIEVLRFPLPAVITCGLRLNEPRKISLRGMMQAKEKPIDRMEMNEMQLELESRSEILSLELVSSGRKCTFLETPEEWVEKLRSEAQVLPS
jgi:electron transfer flavoprotein beta subunit